MIKGRYFIYAYPQNKIVKAQYYAACLKKTSLHLGLLLQLFMELIDVTQSRSMHFSKRKSSK